MALRYTASALFLGRALLALLAGTRAENICKSPDRSKVEAALSRYSFPKGGELAGNFTEDNTAHSVPDCVTSCCRSGDCNLAFLFKDSCFLISCNASYPEGCETATNPEDESLHNVYLVRVRSIDETSEYRFTSRGSIMPSGSTLLSPSQLAIVRSDASDESEHSTSSDARVGDTRPINESASASLGHRPSTYHNVGKICQLNVDNDCPPLEHCVASSGRRRHGMCTCLTGHERTEPSGTCQLIKGNGASISTLVVEQAPVDGKDSSAINSGMDSTLIVNRLKIEPTTQAPPREILTTKLSDRYSDRYFKVIIVGATTVRLPEASFKLRGQLFPEAAPNETFHFRWTLTRLSGDANAELPDQLQLEEPVFEVAGLKVGSYVVTLFVNSSERRASSTVNLTVLAAARGPNVAPEAIIVEANRSLTLPIPLLVFNGSMSYDDVRIVSYRWIRNMMSPAAGDIVGHSDSEPVFLLANLVAGLYHFSLTVTDDDGAHSTAHSFVTVAPDPNETDLVELVLEVPIGKFSVADQQALTAQLGLLLFKPSLRTDVIVHRVSSDRRTGKLAVNFVTRDSPADPDDTVAGSPTVRSALEVALQLKQKLLKSPESLPYPVTSVDTLMCINNCSGHGHCDQLSRECICDIYWVPNVIDAYITGRSNCDWGIFYIIFVVLGSLCGTIALLWLCCCCYRRCSRRSSRRRQHVYRLLNDLDNLDKTKDSENTKIAKAKGANYVTPMLASESDVTSEDDAEDTIFIKGIRKNNTASSGRKILVTSQALPSATVLAEANHKNKLHA